jgi:hypothetical protein
MPALKHPPATPSAPTTTAKKKKKTSSLSLTASPVQSQDARDAK